MALIQRKKQMPEPTSDKTPLEAQGEVFAMAAVGGDSNLKEAASRLRDMSGAERRELRNSIQQLDYLLDDVSLELMARRGK